ncbi:unnamed protein product [Mycena citricolor]|uniref:Uncharacterized protein n=1 Tax=Mycena citricolor TaxID=2018698 RepID=A0AAD2K666_9AGAR|nr:unnamed protein product [Mycena citricolor]
MGRRARHLTLAAKKDSQRISGLKYALSEHGQTRRADRKARSKLGESPGSNDPTPPAASGDKPPNGLMLALAEIPLPTENALFRRVVDEPDSVDESDFPRWLAEPPFAGDDAYFERHSAEYQGFTKALETAMHGVQFRMRQARHNDLHSQFLCAGDGKKREELFAEVRAMLAGWWKKWEVLWAFEASGTYDPLHDARQHAMLKHQQQWVARNIVHFYGCKFLA